MDANALLSGESRKGLPETCVIMITKQDTLKGGLAVYRVDRRIGETDAPFEDGPHILYVNAARQDDTPLGRPMHDFTCIDPSAMHYRVLAERIRHFKEDDGSIETMSDSYQRFIDEVCVPLAEDMAEEKAEEIAEGMASERADASYRRLVHRLIDDGFVTEQLAAEYAPSNMQGSAKQS